MKDAQISCLMVSSPKGARFTLFQRSVECFLQQTYRNKELVVVLNKLSKGDLKRALSYLRAQKNRNIRWTWAGHRKNLGQLRNMSIDLAQGAVLCQWDDDDIHHPRRLELQKRALCKRGVAYLQDIFHFFPGQDHLYWLNWKCRNSFIPGMPSTVMFTSDIPLRYPEEGPRSIKGEDTDFYLKVKANGRIPMSFLKGQPELYTYVFHGGNVWHELHHSRTAITLSVSDRKLHLDRKKIQHKISKLPLGHSQVLIMGPKGLAYRVQL